MLKVYEQRLNFMQHSPLGEHANPTGVFYLPDLECLACRTSASASWNLSFSFG